MKKHAHHKPKSHKKANREAGFLAVTYQYMNRNDKFIVIGITVGIVLLLGVSIYLIINRQTGSGGQLVSVTPTPTKRILTPYPTLPPVIEDETVLLNRRVFLPKTVTIKAGGTVGFYNEDEIPVVVEGGNSTSSFLSLGSVLPQDIPVVTFSTPGTYKYQNAADPSISGEIVVEE